MTDFFGDFYDGFFGTFFVIDATPTEYIIVSIYSTVRAS